MAIEEIAVNEMQKMTDSTEKFKEKKAHIIERKNVMINKEI